MKYLFRVLAMLAVLGLAACDETSSGFDVDKVDQSVVRVYLGGRNIQTGKLRAFGKGTGFVIADGIVVTNDHVVVPRFTTPTGYNRAYLIPDGSFKRIRFGKLLWTSKALDLAVLRVEGLKRPPLVISDLPASTIPKKGKRVIAVGFPGVADNAMRGDGQLVSTVTRGVVGKVGKATGPGGKLRNVIQHSAPINQGNSGGPLFNECHHVIGVNTFGPGQSFRIVTDRAGNQVARGPALVGHFYSPHSENLLQALRTVPALKGIPFRTSTAVCTVQPGGIPVLVYILIAVFTIVAASAAFIAFRKGGTREVIKVVESYSQWVRRKGPAGGPASADATRRPGGDRTGPSSGSSPSVASEAPGTWILVGSDGEGNAVRLSITPDELARPEGVVIGRSKSQADKILTDGSVSRRHAQATAVDGQLMLTDLSSAHGTTVNGLRLTPDEPAAVAEGAMIVVGSVSLQLSRHGT